MSYETIEVKTRNTVTVITLNRPKELNSIDCVLLGELRDCLESIEADERTRVVVITGSGKTFSAGADIKQISGFYRPDEITAFSRRVSRLADYIESFSCPVIAAVNGLAMGGGCELSLACDFRVAAETARFGLPEIKLGLIPGAGGTQRLIRHIGVGHAKDMLLTGRTVSAKEAASWGLIQIVGDNALDLAFHVAQQLLEMPSVAMRLARHAINHGVKYCQAAGLGAEDICFSHVASTRDAHEGVSAFLEKRSPQFQGM